MPNENLHMQTIEQQRACFALEQVEEIIDKSYMKEFKSYANALPAMIHMNGLGQAVAFCKEKSTTKNERGKAYDELFNLLENWLTGKQQPYAESTLLKGITSKDMHTYRLAQAEAIALLSWVKKFANAFAKETPKDEQKKKKQHHE